MSRQALCCTHHHLISERHPNRPGLSMLRYDPRARCHLLMKNFFSTLNVLFYLPYACEYTGKQRCRLIYCWIFLWYLYSVCSKPLKSQPKSAPSGPGLAPAPHHLSRLFAGR